MEGSLQRRAGDGSAGCASSGPGGTGSGGVPGRPGLGVLPVCGAQKAVESGAPM